MIRKLKDGIPAAVACAALLALAPSRGAATSMVKLDDDALVRLSSVIDEGRVTSVRSDWTPDHRQIHTLVTIRVGRALKGTAPANGLLVLRFLGGQVGDTVMEAVGQPTFTVDEDVIVFLDAEAIELFPVTGLYQGKFTVVPNPTTGASTVVERGISRDAFVRSISRLVAVQKDER